LAFTSLGRTDLQSPQLAPSLADVECPRSGGRRRRGSMQAVERAALPRPPGPIDPSIAGHMSTSTSPRVTESHPESPHPCSYPTHRWQNPRQTGRMHPVDSSSTAQGQMQSFLRSHCSRIQVLLHLQPPLPPPPESARLSPCLLDPRAPLFGTAIRSIPLVFVPPVAMYQISACSTSPGPRLRVLGPEHRPPVPGPLPARGRSCRHHPHRLLRPHHCQDSGRRRGSPREQLGHWCLAGRWAVPWVRLSAKRVAGREQQALP